MQQVPQEADPDVFPVRDYNIWLAGTGGLGVDFSSLHRVFVVCVSPFVDVWSDFVFVGVEAVVSGRGSPRSPEPICHLVKGSRGDRFQSNLIL